MSGRLSIERLRRAAPSATLASFPGTCLELMFVLAATPPRGVFTGSDTRVLTKSRDRTIERVLQGGRERAMWTRACAWRTQHEGASFASTHCAGTEPSKAIGGGLAVFKNTARPRACGLEERT